MTTHKLRIFVSTFRIKLLVLFLLLSYTLAGFYLLPWWIHNHLLPSLAKEINRPISVSGIATNPFTLSISINKLRLQQADKTPFLSAHRVYANFNLSTVFGQRISISELRIDGLDLLVSRDTDAQFNFADIVSAPSDEPGESSETEYEIQQLLVDGRRLSIHDAVPPTPFELNIRRFSVNASKLSSDGQESADISVRIDFSEQGQLNAEGQWDGKNQALAAEFSFTDFPLKTIWRYLRDQTSLLVEDGRLTGSGRLDWQPAQGLNLQLARNRIDNLHISAISNSETLIFADSITLQDADLSTSRRSLKISSLDLEQPSLLAWFDSQGRLNWQQMFAHTSQQPLAPADDSGWQISIAQTHMADGEFRMVDGRTRTPVSLLFHDISISHLDFDTDASTPSKFNTIFRLFESGDISIGGQINHKTGGASLNIKVAKLPLSGFQNYLSEVINSHIDRGTIDAQLLVEIAQDCSMGQESDAAGCGGLGLSGELTVTDFATSAPGWKQPELFSWKLLQVGDIAFDSTRNLLRIGQIELLAPSANMIIGVDGQSNLSDVFRVEQGEGSEQSEELKLAIELDLVKITDGTLAFSDYSLDTFFAARIEQLQGQLSQLSTTPGSTAKLDLSGVVDQYSELRIDGELNPLLPQAYIDIGIHLDALEMATLSPFVAQYAGYKVDKGKISLDMEYHVEQRNLSAGNHLLIQRLSLGDRVESKDAASLPLPLAISLLKDSEDNIQIDLPIRGNLDDPDFKYGSIVVKAFIGLITKAVTAPFALLGGLIGGNGDELSEIEFSPAVAAIGIPAQQRLGKLAAALSLRPQLNLEIRGIAYTDTDSAALRNLKFEALIAQYAARRSTSVLSDYLAILSEIEQAIGVAAPKSLAAAPTALEIESRAAMIKSTLEIEPNELSELAQKRAANIRKYLVNNALVAADRIFLSEATVAVSKQAGQIKLVLKLTPR